MEELLVPIISGSLENDKFRQTLMKGKENIEGELGSRKLSTIGNLVADVRNEFVRFSDIQLDVLSLLSSHEGMLNWILEKESTEEFNRLLQVCRPCTDDPRLLSA